MGLDKLKEILGEVIYSSKQIQCPKCGKSINRLVYNEETRIQGEVLPTANNILDYSQSKKSDHEFVFCCPICMDTVSKSEDEVYLMFFPEMAV